jgi:hypothetical protein
MGAKAMTINSQLGAALKKSRDEVSTRLIKDVDWEMQLGV